MRGAPGDFNPAREWCPVGWYPSRLSLRAVKSFGSPKAVKKILVQSVSMLFHERRKGMFFVARKQMNPRCGHRLMENMGGPIMIRELVDAFLDYL